MKSELKRLYKKYNEDEKLDTLNDADGEVKWIAEIDF